MDITKRHLLQGLALAPFLALGDAARALAQSQALNPQDRSYAAHMELMGAQGLKMHGEEEIGMVLYPGFTALDLVGPQYLFASLMGAKVHLITTEDTLDPVMSDTGLAIAPTLTLADAPKELTISFVPGGTSGTAKAMQNDALLDLLRTQASAGRTVSAVCTGTLVLGMAGLLKGKQATSHWITRPLLENFGATPVNARVVKDGQIVTGAGVTAGFDFGLAMVAGLRGDLYAKALQLQAEYAPEPPFQSGTPEEAGDWLRSTLRDMSAVILDEFETLSRTAGATG